MQLTSALEELSEAELLDHADEAARLRRECEVQELRIALQHAVLNNPETLDPGLASLPGRERAKRYGGLGTPRGRGVSACATLAGRLGITGWAAASLISDALDIAIRLPRVWRRVERFEVKVSYARHVARQSLPHPGAGGDVDLRVSDVALRRIPWSRYEAVVAGAVAAADPAAAAERERLQAEQQFAKASRSSEAGMRGFYVRAPFHVITLLDARVAWLADMLEALDDTDSLDQRRVKAIAILANPHLAVELITAFQAWKDRPADPPEAAVPDAAAEPERTGDKPVIDWTRVLPRVSVTVHTYRPACRCDEPATGILRVPDVGPLTDDWVRRWLGNARFTITPTLDLAGQAPVDGYEVPDPHRRAVSVMTPADSSPSPPPPGAGPTRSAKAPRRGRAPPQARAVTDRQLRADDAVPPPHQDPRWMGGPAALPGDLRLGGTRTARSTWSTTPGPGDCPESPQPPPEDPEISMEQWFGTRQSTRDGTTSSADPARPRGM